MGRITWYPEGPWYLAPALRRSPDALQLLHWPHSLFLSGWHPQLHSCIVAPLPHLLHRVDVPSLALSSSVDLPKWSPLYDISCHLDTASELLSRLPEPTSPPATWKSLPGVLQALQTPWFPNQATCLALLSLFLLESFILVQSYYSEFSGPNVCL